MFVKYFFYTAQQTTTKIDEDKIINEFLDYEIT
jgi:hypothetical protein